MSIFDHFRLSSLVALAALVSCAAASAQDIYIGTLELEKSTLVLRRCDITEQRYELVDPPGAKDGVVLRQRKSLKSGKPPVYAEVIGVYDEAAGRSRLVVRSFANVTHGKSCHLIDAVDDLVKAQEKK